MKFFSQNTRFSNFIVMYIKGLVVLALFCALVYVNMTRPRILVLHSYAEDFSWVTDFNTAFRNSFKHGSNPVIYYSYMNTLNKQTLRYKNRAGQEAMQMIRTTRPDYILGIFTDANEFALQPLLNHKHIKIIFNMKSDPAKLKFDTGTNTQGLKGQPALKALNDMLLIATPNRPVLIAHVGDQAASVRLYDKYITEYSWKDVVLVDSILINDFSQWQKAIKSLEGKVDYIILSKYFALAQKEGSKNMVPTKEVMKWTRANSNTPLIGLYTAVAEEGGDIAIEDSPFEQGRIMAEILVTLLNGKKVDPKMRSTDSFITARGKNSRIKLPEVYDSFSTALNEYKRH